ncbi:MAG TPA: nuclear transport factor 2 family protein [Acidimicrobiales bacterium]|nr:nuclear transport factor 2 family protein [Acidimicrobiales bacterium]
MRGSPRGVVKAGDQGGRPIRRRRYGGPITAPLPPPSPDLPGDEAAVADVVARFYAAFEARDLDTMSDLWVHDDRVSCTHPGWAALHGWAAVSASWFAIFDQSPPLQVFVTEERVHVSGDLSWVTVDENLLGAGAEDGGTTVSALKVLSREPAGWRIVAHHGSVVVGRPD